MTGLRGHADHRERGYVAVWLALMMPAFCGIAALAHLYQARRRFVRMLVATRGLVRWGS